MKVIHNITCLDLFCLNSWYGYEYYVLGIAGTLIILFLFGYWAQVKASKGTFWDAYRRYELRKNLEIRYGDITLSMGLKDDYKKMAMEYIVDRWFLAAEMALQTVSSSLLTRIEAKYIKLSAGQGFEGFYTKIKGSISRILRRQKKDKREEKLKKTSRIS
jgi:hypothetical protein